LINQTIREVDLENLNGGAIQELFDVEWKKIVDNIADLNTKPDAAREITIKVVIRPDKLRRTAVSKVAVTSKLPAMQPHESFVFFDRKDGDLVAYPDDPHQGKLEGIEDGQEEQAVPGMRSFSIAK
jgi:hypothetical protein